MGTPAYGQPLNSEEALEETGLSGPAREAQIESAIQSMNEAELDGVLTGQNLSTDGSLEQKRNRLRKALGVAERGGLSPVRQSGRISIENAAEGEYIRGEEDDRGLLKLRGRIKLRVGDGYFLADLVIIDSKRKEIYAEGNLIYRSADAEIRADRFIFDQRLQSGIVYNAEGYQNPVFFVGKNARQLSEGKLSVSHVYFTGCAEDPPHYNLSARKVYIYEDDKVVALGAVYHVGGVPLLPLPFVYGSNWGTGIISQFGHSDVQGFFWQNTYQFSVPEAYLSSFLPMGYRFTADYYEKTGSVGGIEMFRFAPELSYFLDFEVAEFKRYEAVNDFRSFDGFRITNNVRRADGTYGQDKYDWYKAFALVSYRNQDYKTNSVQNLAIRYEDYTHRLHEFEFGARYQPTSTIPALYENSEAGRGLIRDSTDWSVTYNDQRDDLTIRVFAQRRRIWREDADFEESEFIPATDVVPSVYLAKNSNLGTIPGIDMPVYWDNSIMSELTKQYSGGDVFQTLSKNEFKTAFRGYISMYPFFTFRPLVGYGARKTLPYGENPSGDAFEALDTQSKKDSYQYFYTEDELTIGPDELFLRGVYRRKDSFKEELKDRAALNLTGFTNNQRVNETEVSVESYPLENINLSVTSVYDHREFEYDIKPGERWSYPVFRADITFNMLGLFRPSRENLLSRRRVHFLELRITNDYVYDPILKRDHSNVAGINFQSGGFDLWLLERLRFLELGFYWYHVYYNPELDHMRYTAKLDVQLTRMIYLELELESRLSDPERYTRDEDPNNPDFLRPESERRTSFWTDVVDGTGLNGQRARQNAAFNVGFFETSLIFDLHDWEMRLGYRLEQRSIPGGLTSFEAVNYYENWFFMSFTLLRFDVGGVGDRPSRFILNRQRVRPQDIGRAGYSFQ